MLVQRGRSATAQAVTAEAPSATAIPLSDLLGELEPRQCKLHSAVWSGHNHPIDVIARSWDEWVGWQRHRGQKDDFNRPFIFSLAQTHGNPNHWLFGGVFEVVERHPSSYDVKLRQDLLGGYLKRLTVFFRRPGGRNVRLRMERWVGEMRVVSVLPEQYAGEPFPGHARIEHPLSQLEVIVKEQRPDWRGALAPLKGVYVIHDRATGKPYVGSAYGATGIWARWASYVESLHGGNKELRELVGNKGPEYARENLVFALLEAWPMTTEDSYVIAREMYWQRVLLSREFGLN
jgi:hypothetical protein